MFPGAPLTNTDEKKTVTEKDIVYVQMHILYTSVHPAAAAAAVEPTARGVQTGSDGSWPCLMGPLPLCKQWKCQCEAALLGPCVQ